MEKYGEIKSLNIIRNLDNRSNGYALVEYQTRKMAECLKLTRCLRQGAQEDNKQARSASRLDEGDSERKILPDQVRRWSSGKTEIPVAAESLN